MRMYVPSKVSGTSSTTVPMSDIIKDKEEEEEEEEGNIVFKSDSFLFSISLSVMTTALSSATTSTSTSTSTALEVELEPVESENKDLLFDRKCATATPFILPPFRGEEKVPISSRSSGVSDEDTKKR